MTDDLFKSIISDFFNNNEVKIKENNFDYSFGTDEWCDETYNTHKNCSRACDYCYSWKGEYRYDTDAKELYGWPMIRKDNWDKSWLDRKSKWVIMYPSKHDINKDNIGDCFYIMRKMLRAKNVHVLWVTKPDYYVVKEFSKFFSDYKEKIVTRLTMTTNDDEQISKWEGTASKSNERVKSIKLLYKKGFNTSISNEPSLLPKMKGKDYINGQIAFIKSMLPYVRNQFWMGLMNHRSINIHHGLPITKEIKEKYDELYSYYTKGNITEIVRKLHDNKKIYWKESIKKFMIDDIIHKNKRGL
jgi:DNA repair photolyase